MMQCEPSNIASFAKKFGITSEMQAVPSLALGTTDVSLFEMVAAYGVFVNGGNYIKPYALLRIEDKFGNVLEEFRPVAKEVISERTAYYMVELLKAGSEYGTSTGRNRRENRYYSKLSRWMVYWYFTRLGNRRLGRRTSKRYPYNRRTGFNIGHAYLGKIYVFGFCS
jgi:membrane peptidoglycan carboxypeptidase